MHTHLVVAIETQRFYGSDLRLRALAICAHLCSSVDPTLGDSEA